MFQWQKVLVDFRNLLQQTNNIDAATIDSILKNISHKHSIKGKQLFMPIRVSLTGKEKGIELHNIVQLLGKDRCIKRVDNALSNLY